MSPISKAAFAAALVLLSGCSGNLGSATPSLGRQPASQADLQPPSPPCATAPNVWTSSLIFSQVYGYDTGGNLICTLTGLSPTNAFATTMGLGTNAAGHLFVADMAANQIVQFKSRGQFVNAWSTDIAGAVYQPMGICVSRTGLIGVADRALDNIGATNVEIFNAAGTMLGYATTPSLQSANYCAFDKAGDFFVNGTATPGSGGGQQVWYLARGDIAANATLTLSTVGNAAYWVGMYSQINTSLTYSLSIASPPVTGTGCNSYCAPITTFQIGNGTVPPPPHGPITLTLHSTCNVTGYPNNYNAVFQLAPLGSTLYMADFGTHSVQSATSICTPGGGTAANAQF